MRPTAKYAFSAVRRLTQHCKQLLRVDRETILDHRASGINHDKPWGAAGTVIHHGRGIATVRRDCVVTEGNPQAVLRLVVAEPIGRVHLHTLEDGLNPGDAEFSGHTGDAPVGPPFSKPSLLCLILLKKKT